MKSLQTFHGNNEEIISYLRGLRKIDNLMLTVPADLKSVRKSTQYPAKAIIRNGVPLFPADGRNDVVCEERVAYLMDEDE